MIKFQFRIIVDKKGIKRTIKPFLGRSVSTLALVLSVVALSTLIGLSIHLVLAAPFTNPTAEPPLGNVDSPINVSDVPQTKAGDLTVDDTLYVNRNIYVDGAVHAKQGAIISSSVYIQGSFSDLHIDSNHWGTNWYSYSLKEYNSDHTLNCPDGSYVRGFTTHDNGKIHYFYCSKL